MFGILALSFLMLQNLNNVLLLAFMESHKFFFRVMMLSHLDQVFLLALGSEFLISLVKPLDFVKESLDIQEVLVHHSEPCHFSVVLEMVEDLEAQGSHFQDSGEDLNSMFIEVNVRQRALHFGHAFLEELGELLLVLLVFSVVAAHVFLGDEFGSFIERFYGADILLLVFFLDNVF